jgi:predicted GNAT superfamily acetyltransferase
VTRVPRNGPSNSSTRTVRLEVPASLADLRQRDPQMPLAWRLATREAFLRCLAAHYAAVDFRRHAGRSFYVLERTR